MILIQQKFGFVILHNQQPTTNQPTTNNQPAMGIFGFGEKQQPNNTLPLLSGILGGIMGVTAGVMYINHQLDELNNKEDTSSRETTEIAHKCIIHASLYSKMLTCKEEVDNAKESYEKKIEELKKHIRDHGKNPTVEAQQTERTNLDHALGGLVYELTQKEEALKAAKEKFDKAPIKPM